MRYEERKARWDRVSPRRIERILSALDNFKMCSNKYNYYYEEGEIDVIFERIRKKLGEIQNAFEEKSQ